MARRGTAACPSAVAHGQRGRPPPGPQESAHCPCLGAWGAAQHTRGHRVTPGSDQPLCTLPCRSPRFVLRLWVSCFLESTVHTERRSVLTSSSPQSLLNLVRPQTYSPRGPLHRPEHRERAGGCGWRTDPLPGPSPPSRIMYSTDTPSPPAGGSPFRGGPLSRGFIKPGSMRGMNIRSIILAAGFSRNVKKWFSSRCVTKAFIRKSSLLLICRQIRFNSPFIH